MQPQPPLSCRATYLSARWMPACQCSTGPSGSTDPSANGSSCHGLVSGSSHSVPLQQPRHFLDASARHPHPTDAHSRALAPLRPRPPFPAVSCEIASLLFPILVLLLQSILPTGMQGRGCKESCCEQEMRGPREQSEGLGWPPVPGRLRAGFILQPMLS